MSEKRAQKIHTDYTSLPILITACVSGGGGGGGGGGWGGGGAAAPWGGEGWIPHKNHWDAFLEAYGFELQFWVSGQKADIFMHTDLALGGIQKNIITFRHTE